MKPTQPRIIGLQIDFKTKLFVWRGGGGETLIQLEQNKRNINNENQKSIEDLDSTVKENKDEIKSLMDRTKALETQNIQKDDKIKELTDEINNTQQHQRNFSICIKGLHVPKKKKDEEFLKYVFYPSNPTNS